MTEASELSQTQFAPDVVFFDSDDEPSLGKEFHGYLARHGIIQQPSAGSGRAWVEHLVDFSYESRVFESELMEGTDDTAQPYSRYMHSNEPQRPSSMLKARHGTCCMLSRHHRCVSMRRKATGSFTANRRRPLLAIHQRENSASFPSLVRHWTSSLIFHWIQYGSGGFW